MGNIPTVPRTKTKAILILSSLVAGILTVAYLSGVFKNKTTQPVTAERRFETFNDFTEKKEDGTYQLKKSRKDKLNTDIKRMRSGAEQYVLLAVEDGYYECFHCPRGVFYLHKNEIVKVGVTRQGEQGRYDQNFYNRMKIRYVVEFTGSLQEAMEKELIRLGAYPLTPENLARPDSPQGDVDRYKLARPIQNTKDQ